MEVNGKEFLRNVGIEQEKADLADKSKKLDGEKRTSLQQTNNDYNNDSAYVDISSNDNSQEEINATTESQIFELRLEENSNKSNKKKYIILGFALAVLFIITIVIIRLASNNEQEEKLATQQNSSQEIKKDKLLDKIDNVEQYKKVIEKKEEPIIEPIERIYEKKEIILPEPIEKVIPKKVEKQVVKPKKEIRRDLFELEEKIVPKKVEKQVQKPKVKVKPKVEKKAKVIKRTQSKPRRKIVVPPATEVDFTKNNNKVKGYYIQIGAFSKRPNDKLLNSIPKKGYRYTVHSVVVKGKKYNKVLIGSYPNKRLALKVISKVKKDFNNPNAYILKF